MTTRQRRRERGHVAELARNGAHLAALSALAFEQPLLDILGRNPAFFAVRGSSGTEIVLFALALTLGPPAVLLAIEAAVGAVSHAAAGALHLCFVGGLAAVVVLHGLTKSEALGGLGALVVAGTAGLAVAAIYARTTAVRTFATFLAPAPLLFLALFLLDSPVSKLVFTETAEARTVDVRAHTPVVLVVFDEFPTVTLMDRRGRIDAVRFPNFAALARDATWYRNSTTVHLTPSSPCRRSSTASCRSPKRLPIFSDHRQNLFTFLGGTYQLDVVEALTHLCPATLCKKTKRKTAGLEPGAGDDDRLARLRRRHRLPPPAAPRLVRLAPSSDQQHVGELRRQGGDGRRGAAVLRAQHLPARVADHGERQARALLRALAPAARAVALSAVGKALRRRRPRRPGRAERHSDHDHVARHPGLAAVLPPARLRGQRARTSRAAPARRRASTTARS